MTNFNERTNTLLYKNIISHTLFSKGWWLLCVRDELETGTDCYIDPAVLISHLGWVAQPWVTEGPKPSVCRWLSIRHLVSNWLKPSRAPGYIIISRPPASAVLPLIYTGASLDWQLGRGSIYNSNIHTPILWGWRRPWSDHVGCKSTDVTYKTLQVNWARNCHDYLI